MADLKQTKDMLGRSGLLPVKQALSILLDSLSDVREAIEEVELSMAFDRILAEDVIAGEDLPAFTRSTMDGYAVRAADTFGASESMPCYLSLTGEVVMGTLPEGSINKGCCFKVPTGGMLPKDADSVVMLEHTVPVDDTMIEVVKGVGTGTNLIQQGEDISCGSIALRAGQKLRPQDIGLLAGLGIAKIKVTKKVRVAVLSTGDEIIEYTEKPQPGEIRNINSLTLAGLVRRAGGVYTDYGIVSDEKELFLAAVEKAARENNIVLFSGGSSVGVRDLGEQVVEALGPPGILVHGVTLKPGKPLLIGCCERGGTTPIFGLPGHPVSAMVCFDFFVKPAIEKLSAYRNDTQTPSPSITARLTRNLNSAAGRLDVIRVKLFTEDNTLHAEPILGKSGSISTLSRADGFFLIGEDSQGVNEDSEIEVFLFK